MNLAELKIVVDDEIENLYDKNPMEVPILINLSESSIGARASTRVKYIGMGFDWEHGQLRIEPIVPLVRKGNAMTDVQKVILHEFAGEKFYACPRCIMKIAKNDHYCRHCGGRLK